jgi:hypothetical protein
MGKQPMEIGHRIFLRCKGFEERKKTDAGDWAYASTFERWG